LHPNGENIVETVI